MPRARDFISLLLISAGPPFAPTSLTPSLAARLAISDTYLPDPRGVRGERGGRDAVSLKEGQEP